jgi:hypothetical protein
LKKRVHVYRTCAIQQRRTLVRKSTIYLFVLGLAVVAMTALASAGLVVSAQNSNSSTTMAPTMAPTNTNKGAKKTTRRRRTTRRKPAAAAADTATTTSDAATTAPVTAPKRTGRCDPTQQEQADLSGTYTGKINYPDASLTGDATLTITGNNFTLTAGSTTQSGRVTAVTTCGYTGATMMFGDLTPPTPSPNPPPAMPAVSVRVKKVGDRVTLMTVPGEKRSFSFGSVGAARPVRKHRTRKAKTSAPPPPAMKM